MTIYKVRKRNGSIVAFDRSKISEAIKKAIIAVGGEDFSGLEDLTTKVIARVEAEANNNIPDIELIQDKVEEVLIKEQHNEVAKAFIVYRQKRREARVDQHVVIEVGKTMDEYLKNLDWRINENANIGYSIG